MIYFFRFLFIDLTINRLKICLDKGVHFKEYKDDGFTGTDADRDDFQRLLSDICTGKINCVIIKDLSRLSRDYVEVGILIDRLFVQMNVRFISLHERIDSYNDPDSVSNMVVPITNVMNDQYCYQTSKKIRQVVDYKKRNGEFIGSYELYGYIKDPSDKHALLVDREAAEVVKQILAMFLNGMAVRAIVNHLNDHGVMCPSLYKQSQGLKYSCPNGQAKPMWSTITVTNMLKNPVYVGDTGIWRKAATASRATRYTQSRPYPKKIGLSFRIPMSRLSTGKPLKRPSNC